MRLDPQVKNSVMALVAQEPSPTRPAMLRLQRLGVAVALGIATWTGMMLSLGCDHLTPGHILLWHLLPISASALLGLRLGNALDPQRLR
jgi:hypothetical protein